MEAEVDLRRSPYPMSASVSAEGIQIESVAGQLFTSGQAASGRLALSGRLSGTLDESLQLVRRSVGGRLIQPGLSGRLTLQALSARTPDLLVPVEGGAVEVEFRNDEARVTRLEGRAGRSDFALTGQVAGLLAWLSTPDGAAPARPLFSAALTSRVLDLDEMLPAVGAAPTGTGSAGASRSWGLATPAYGAAEPVSIDETSPLLWIVRTMDGDGRLRFGEMVSDGVVYRNFRSETKAQGRVLRLDEVRADVFGGKMAAQIELDAQNPGGNLPVEAVMSVDTVQAQGLLKGFLKWGLPIQGRMGLSLTMSGAVDSTLELVQKTIRAEGRAQASEGKVVNWSLLRKVGSGVSQLGFMDFEEIPLRSLLAPFHVANERVYLDELRVRAADMDCRIAGSSGLDGSLDLTVDVDVPASRMNIAGMQLGQTLQGLLGGAEARIPLRIHVGGTVEAPQVKAQLQPRERKQAEPQEQLKEKGKGLLRKLF